MKAVTLLLAAAAFGVQANHDDHESHGLGVLRLVCIALGGVLEPDQIGAGCLQLYHQLVAIEHQIEVSVTVLVGTVAVAFMFVVVCLHAKGGGCQ